MAKITQAKLDANKRYQDQHKEQQRLYRYRSYARKYVKELASESDLLELQARLEERLKELNKR